MADADRVCAKCGEEDQCLARRQILEKINVCEEEEAVGMADIVISSGQVFTCLITNERDRSFFGCPTWIQLAHSCGFQAGGALWMSPFEANHGRIKMCYTDRAPTFYYE